MEYTGCVALYPTHVKWRFPVYGTALNSGKIFQALLHPSELISQFTDAMQGHLPADLTACTEGVVSAHYRLASKSPRSWVTVCRHLASNCAFSTLHVAASQNSSTASCRMSGFARHQPRAAVTTAQLPSTCLHERGLDHFDFPHIKTSADTGLPW